MITKDLHVHLHGCLTAEQLWNIGKDTYKNRTPMLEWYASEYEKAWGRKPKYLDYWESDNGFELLKNDYLFKDQNSFDKFQANFNLIIALCNITSNDFFVQEQIIKDVKESKLEYFEARTLIPFRFDAKESYEYLKGLCKSIKQLNAEGGLTTKLVFSLFRDNDLAKKHYDWIRSFMNMHKDLGEEIVGVDFAYKEEGSPPKSKIDLFKQFHEDNRKYRKLALLYHVGESFEDKGIISAIRWIIEAHELRVDRLGHAIALGVNPENYEGKVIFETVEERSDTLNWMINNRDLLNSHGFKYDFKKTLNELDEIRSGKNRIRIQYDSEYIKEAKSFQKAAFSLLRTHETKVTIETCPTSNLRIGQINSLKYHPIINFNKEKINFVVGTDDPGIFDIDWSSEYKFANELLQKYD